MQAASDVFLGWMTGPARARTTTGASCGTRSSPWISRRCRSPGILAYARICGWALARAHARSGNAAAIAAYMGTSGRFERSMLEFAESYADQNDRDHAALVSGHRAPGASQAEAGI